MLSSPHFVCHAMRLSGCNLVLALLIRIKFYLRQVDLLEYMLCLPDFSFKNKKEAPVLVLPELW